MDRSSAATPTLPDALPLVVAFDPLAAPETAESLKAKSLRGSLVTGAGQGAKLILGVVSQLILARVLFPADFGLLAMAYPVIALVGLLSDIGIGESIIQRKDVDHRQVSTLFWVSVAVSGVLCLIVMAAAPLVAAVYRDPRITSLLMVMALALPLGAAGGLPASILTRQMRFGVMAKIEVAAAAAGLLATFGCALAGGGYWSLIVGNFTATLTTSAFAWRACRWIPSGLGLMRNAADHLRFGGHITLANLATFASTSADNAIIGFVNGAAALGLYDRSYRLTAQPITQLLSPISRVALPLLSRYVDEPEEYKAIYLDMVRAVMLVTLPLMLFCMVDGRELVDILLGSRWHQAGPIFQWVALGGAAAGVNVSTAWLFVSQARTASLRRYSIASAVIHVASFAVGATLGITYVAALGAIGFVTVTTPLMLFGATRRHSVSFRSVTLALATFAPATIISIIGAVAIDQMRLSKVLDLAVTGGLIGLAFLLFVCLVPSQNRLTRRILSELAKISSDRRPKASSSDTGLRRRSSKASASSSSSAP